jgi:long-chain fatty acid transport protein
MSQGGAVVATGCEDGSSVFFNPSQLSSTDGPVATVGTAVLDINGDFRYGAESSTGGPVDLQNKDAPVPHAYFSYGLSGKTSVGIGGYAPYGLGVKWPKRSENGKVFAGAFEGFDNEVQSFYIQPTVSYQITPRLSVGGGPVVAVSTIEINQFQDLSQVNLPSGGTFGDAGVPASTPFATMTLDQSGTGFGGNIGLSYKISSRLDVGLRYTSPVTVEYDGTASPEQVESGFTVPASSPLAQDLNGDGNADPTPAGALVAGQFGPESVLDQYEALAGQNGPLSSQNSGTEITFPMQVVAGISFQATPRLRLETDYQFTGWSSFENLPLEFENLEDQKKPLDYNDTHALRVGAELDVIEAVSLRGGYAYTSSAVPDKGMSPFVPESTRNHYTVGVGWDVTEMVTVDVSYQRLQQNKREGSLRPALPEASVSQGQFNVGANYLGIGASLRF